MTSNTVGSSSATQIIEIVQRGPQGAAGLSDGNKGDVTVSSNGTAVAINAGVIVDADINADAEIAVSKLADGSARQLLQTNTAGTGVEWASNIDVQGTLAVTGAATFDSSATFLGSTSFLASNFFVGAATFSHNVTINNSNGYFKIQNGSDVDKFSVDTDNGNTLISGTLGITGNTSVTGTLTSLSTNTFLGDTSIGDSDSNTLSITAKLNTDLIPSATTIDLGSSSSKFGELYLNGVANVGSISGAAVVTSGWSTSDTQVYSAKRSDELYFNKNSLEEIKSNTEGGWSANDNAVATTAAIDARIIDLVDDVGGFVPIANETSFPNANPDVNNGAGTIVSISSLSGNLTSNGSGVITIANGTAGNSTVTINGAGTSETYLAGYGMLVETTTTLNTYTFHRSVPKATEVTTVASKATEIGRLGTADAIADMNTLGTTAIVSDMDTLADISSNITTVAGISSNVTTVAGNTTNINTVAGVSSNVTSVAGSITHVNTVATNITNVSSFANRYRISNSAPASNNDLGDLYYDTSTNLLNIYNGSSWDVATALNNSGGTITGNTRFTDNTQLQFGDATTPDLKIYHAGTSHDTYIDDQGAGQLRLCSNKIAGLNAAHDAYIFIADETAGVELYYAGDTTAKLETTSTGAKITGKLEVNSDAYIKGSSGDGTVGIQIRSGASAIADQHQIRTGGGSGDILFIEAAGSSGEVRVKTNGSDALTLDSSQNATFAGNVSLADAGEVRLGDNGELQLFQESTESNLSRIYSSSNSSGLSINSDLLKLKNEANDKDYIVCTVDGNVDIYGHGATTAKFSTTSDGAKITGLLNVSTTGSDAALFESTSGNENGVQLSLRATSASPANDDVLAKIDFSGKDDADGFATYAQIRSHIKDVRAGERSGDITFHTRHGNAFAERLSIASNGDATFAGKLIVDGASAYDAFSSSSMYIDGYVCMGRTDTTVSSGNDIGGLRFYSNDSSIVASGSFLKVGGIDCTADGDFIGDYSADPSTASAPTRIVFSTMKTGTTTLTEALKLDSSQSATFAGNILPSDDDATNIGDSTTNFNTIWASSRFRGNDNVKLALGNSQDFIIRHVDGTGNLIESPTGSDLHIKMMGGTMDNADQTAAEFIEDGACKFYFNGSADAKLQTTSTGIAISGGFTTSGASAVNSSISFNDDISFYGAAHHIYFDRSESALEFQDSAKATFGTGNDLQIYHGDGTSSHHSYITHGNASGNFFISSQANISLRASGTDNGVNINSGAGVWLAWDGTTHFETTSDGAKVTGSLGIGVDATRELHVHSPDTTSTYISLTNTTTGTTTGDGFGIGISGGTNPSAKLVNYESSNMEFHNAGSLALTLDSSQNATFAGDVDLASNKKIKLGNSDELQIHTNETSNYIESIVTGDSAPVIHLRSNGGMQFDTSGSGGTWFKCLTSDAELNNTTTSVELYYANNLKFQTTNTGSYTTGTHAQSGSDIRLKENIVNITGAVSKVKQLQGFNYNFNSVGQDLGFSNKLDIGLSAQDVEKVVPEVVSKIPKTDYLTVNYEKLVPLLIESIKELSTEVETLKTKVAALEAGS